MAAPGTDKTDPESRAGGASPQGAPAPKSGAPKAGAAAAPGAKPARRGGVLSKLLISALAVAGLVGGVGYAALTFRDADPRIAAAAGYVDESLQEARGLIDKGEALVAGLTGETAKSASPPAGAPEQTAPTSQPAAPAETAASPPETAKEPEKTAEAPAAPAETPRETAAPDKAKPIEATPADALPSERPAPSQAVAPTPSEAKPLETKPLDAKAAEAAPAAAAKGVDADGFSDRDLISALEGRIDALSDEVKGLRERLDAPKNETRAAPEAETPKPAAVDATGAAVVLAFALQRDLESGRPFAEEIAAFSRLATDPAPSPALIEIAEKGAPTGAQLREAFLPVAKMIRAQESPAAQENVALTDQLLQGASKLVKVRPTGEAEPESVDGKLKRIETALTHNDFAAAESLYGSLPEPARTQSKDFGAALRLRAEAARAADELLRGAIAALGKK